MIIFAHKHTIKQTKSNSKAEATFYPLWSVDTLVAGQLSNFSGRVTPVPGESQLSTSVSIDYSSLLTKDESIIETPRDPNWNLNFGQLTNETFVPISSNNRSQCVQKFHSPTCL